MSDLPITYQEPFNLTALGIAPQNISFSNVSLESDKFICIRDTASENKTINIVEVATQQVTINKVNAESAIMNPSTKVLALRGTGNKLQIFNLEMKSKLSEHTMNEDVLFWKWISPKTIAIVTATSVYHWSVEGNQTPKKVFDRHQRLEGATVINYRVDSTEKWLLLVGIARGADGSMQGVLQLYSVDKQSTQFIEGHAGAFVDFKLSSSYTATLIVIASNSAQGGRLFVMEVPGNKPETAPKFERKMVPMTFQVAGDFPVAMQGSDKYGVVYIITKMGYLYVYDVETAFLIYSNRITSDTVFVSAPHTATSGLIGISRNGSVMVVTVNEKTIVSYLNQRMGNGDLAIKIAVRANLPGADELYVSQFRNLIQAGQVQQAVELAADSPHGILRTPQTIQMLQRLPVMPNSKPPLSAYFQFIIERSKLNAFETVELAKIVLQKPGGVDYLKGLMEQDKIECSEQLGDMIRAQSPEVAMQIYLKGGAHEKIIESLVMRGDFERVLAYCQKVNYQPNYIDLFRKFIQINPDSAVKFAVKVFTSVPGSLDANTVVDIFAQLNLLKQATAFLLDILKEDKEQDANLQTRLLELNLMYPHTVQVADTILAQNMFTHFDKKKIGQMCERANLFQRALENYNDIADRKRVIVQTQFFNPEWLVGFFGNFDQEESLSYLRELMRVNPRQNLNIVVQVAQKYSEELGPLNLIKIFEDVRSYDGLYFYLVNIVDFSKDPDVHFKFIEAAVKTSHYADVERITRESDYYDAERVKEFLKEMKLQDQMPLINVCDKYNFVEEMVRHFCNTNQMKFIDLYVKQRNPLKTPVVVGALLDVDASEDFIRNIINSVGNLCPVEPLVMEVEKRNRLKILLPFLEARVKEGSQDPACHNALAKIYIDINQDAEKFLNTNPFYDSKIVGKYCEKRDPHLAFVAYKRGQCDFELVEVTNKNSMFKQQARYLIGRQSADLWAHVLNDENKYREQLIDQIVNTALPETANPDEVSSTVKAFMSAELHSALINLLEQIVLHGNTEFRKNKNLQNLLILTAIKAEPTKVMEFINKLDNYDAADIATIAVQKKLYDEAFVIYSKFKLHSDAVRVLLEYIGDIPRAAEYANNVNLPEVYSLLGRAQLAAVQVSEAIASFLKADDASAYHEVIAMSENTEKYIDLIKFLKMARNTIHDSHVDTELIYSFAKAASQNPNSNYLADLEDFITSPNTAQIQVVGDRCYDEQLYEAARILFTSISNFARLSSTLVRLGRYKEAVNAATKANSIRTWKEVLFACIDAEDFKYAQACGLNIITHADELDDLIQYYEVRGFWEQLINLLEKGLGLERAHMGIFTQLGILYCKYRPEAVMEHINRYWRKCHIPRLLVACEQNALWAEVRFLYAHHDEFDNAIKIMMEHPAEAFDHQVFLENVVHLVNNELFYKSIQFYLDHYPAYVTDLLATITAKIDHERVARDARSSGSLPLIKKYLENVQQFNLVQVNEALNSLYIEEEDFESLRTSIEQYTNFDQVALAKQLESHTLLEFRRIAALLYKTKKQWSKSIELSQQDKLYKDAMETAAASSSQEISENLLQFFVDNDLKDCFAACLYTCYSFIRPDVAMELAWKAKIMDMAYPYFIQVVREYTTKVDDLVKAQQLAKKEKLSLQQAPEQAAPVYTPEQPTSAYGYTPEQTGAYGGYGQFGYPTDPNAGAYGYPQQPNAFF